MDVWALLVWFIAEYAKNLISHMEWDARAVILNFDPQKPFSVLFVDFAKYLYASPKFWVLDRVRYQNTKNLINPVRITLNHLWGPSRELEIQLYSFKISMVLMEDGDLTEHLSWVEVLHVPLKFAKLDLHEIIKVFGVQIELPRWVKGQPRLLSNPFHRF